MIQEPVVELAIELAPVICRVMDFHSTTATLTEARARMMVARLDSQPASFQSQRNAGHDVLHQLIKATLAERHQDIKLVHSASGSPQLMCQGQPSRFSVSIAHSKRWLAAGLAENCMMGVDIEINSHRGNALALARWLEWEVAEKDDESFADTFIRQWVLWEACAKCARQSMLKKQNPGFTALQASLSRTCFGTSGGWTGWRDHIDHEAQFAVVLFDDTAGRLQHREMNPEGLTPW